MKGIYRNITPEDDQNATEEDKWKITILQCRE